MLFFHEIRTWFEEKKNIYIYSKTLMSQDSSRNKRRIRFQWDGDESAKVELLLRRDF